jgi:hypothetical protein
MLDLKETSKNLFIELNITDIHNLSFTSQLHTVLVNILISNQPV